MSNLFSNVAKDIVFTEDPFLYHEALNPNNGLIFDTLTKVHSCVLLDCDTYEAGEEFFASEEFAEQLTKYDPLAELKELFIQPQWNKDGVKGEFRGNSLGLMSHKTREYMNKELDIWATKGHEGHFEKDETDPNRDAWRKYHEGFQTKLAPLFGCQENEIVAMGSLSSNNVLTLFRFYAEALKKGRTKIIIEQGLFPFDIDNVRSIVAVMNHVPIDKVDQFIIEVPRREDQMIHNADMQQAIHEAGNDLALTFIGGVNYYTGQLLDIQMITRYAQIQGAYALFDLAHAGGNVPLELHEWGVDAANCCSYKYLNSGPGSVGISYVHEKNHELESIKFPMGRWGRDKEYRFDFDAADPRSYVPAEGIRRTLISNDPIFSMAPLRASLEIFDKVGMERLRNKSIILTGYLEYLLDKKLGKEVIDIVTPRDPSARGCQLSFKIIHKDFGMNLRDNAQRVHDALKESGFGVEQRDDIIRIAPVPLYNNYSEVYSIVEELQNILNFV